MEGTRPIPVQHVPKAMGKVGVTETVNGAMEFVKAKMKYVTMVPPDQKCWQHSSKNHYTNVANTFGQA